MNKQEVMTKQVTSITIVGQAKTEQLVVFMQLNILVVVLTKLVVNILIKIIMVLIKQVVVVLIKQVIMVHINITQHIMAIRQMYISIKVKPFISTIIQVISNMSKGLTHT